jgi:hypothetical protein
MTRRPGRRPILRSPEPIAGVIGRAERDGVSGAKPNVSMQDWVAAVGARIAERAQPIELDRGTLVVRVATSVWASELSLLATPILERLAARGLEVRALRYRVGAVEAPRTVAAFRATRAVPAPQPLPPELLGALAAVGDDDLRASIADAARANLAWQAYVGPGAPGTEPAATTAASRAARVPRSAETETDPRDRTTGAGPAASRRRP